MLPKPVTGDLSLIFPFILEKGNAISELTF